MKNLNKRIKKHWMFLLLIMGISIISFPKKLKLDPESENFYNYARHLFIKNERKIFLNLPTNEDRHRFIDHFWEIRDPNPYTEENEFKVEMEERFEYIEKYLREGVIPGWKTDRGRIYILLGPPTSTYQDYSPYGGSSLVTGIIYWYYAGTNILVRFIEKRNDSFFRMDLRSTSLKLLDELKNRKYYIRTDEDAKFETDLLEFDLTYNSQNNELLFKLEPDKISFEETDSGMTAKFKIDLMIYSGKNDFSKLREIKSITVDNVDKESFLKEQSKLEVKIPITLPPGKVKIDAIVTDLYGDATQRKFITINKKSK